MENERETAGYLKEPDRKTVSFTVKGKSACFVTILEAGREAGRVRAVNCSEFGSVEIEEADKTRWVLSADYMAEKGSEIAVRCHRR